MLEILATFFLLASNPTMPMKSCAEVERYFGCPVAPRLVGTPGTPLRVGRIGDACVVEAPHEAELPVESFEISQKQILIAGLSIDSRGEIVDVRQLKPVRGVPDDALLAALRKWKFKPGTRYAAFPWQSYKMWRCQ